MFGLLFIGIAYQSIALLKGKSMSEVIAEITSAVVAVGSGQGGDQGAR